MFQCSDIAPTAGVGKDGAGIGMAVGHSAAKHPSLSDSSLCGLLENPVAVVGSAHVVSRITMENDGRHGRAVLPKMLRILFPPTHRDERGGKVAGGTAGEAGMICRQLRTDRDTSRP